jgi:hypothetical protein
MNMEDLTAVTKEMATPWVPVPSEPSHRRPLRGDRL